MKFNKGLTVFLFIFLFLVIFSGTYVDSKQDDKEKFYNSNIKRTTIHDKNTKEKYAEITLIENTDFCMVNCYAIIHLNLFKKYTNPFNKIKFYDKKNMNQKEILSSNILIKKNIEDNWEDYDITDELEGSYYFKIIGEKDKKESIEWIPEFFGIEIDEWATWSSSFDTGLFAYYDCENGTNVANPLKYNLTTSGSGSTYATDDSKAGFGKYCNVTSNGKFQVLDTNNNSNPFSLGNYSVDDMNFTMNVWVYPIREDLPDARVFTKENSLDDGWSIRQNGDTFKENILGAGSVSTANLTDNPLPWENWWMLTLIGNDTHVTIYLNNTFKSFDTLDTRRYADKLVNLGGNWDDNNGQLGFDEFAFWNRSLSQSEINDLWNSGIGLIYGSSAPVITMVTPPNGTNSSDVSIDVNFTYIDINEDFSKCWYTNDSGKTNSTPGAFCDNLTSFDWEEGFHNITIYANDTFEGLTSNNVSFTIDTIKPFIEIESPTNQTNTSDTTLDIEYNYSAGDGTRIWDVWYTNDTNSINLSLPPGTNITNLTWAEGGHNVTIYANDSANNFNETRLSFIVDTLVPNVTIEEIETTSGSKSINANMTINDTNLHNCTYSIFESGGTVEGANDNVSFVCEQNITSASTTNFGTFTIEILAFDGANNQNSTRQSFTTSSAPGGGGGGGGGTTPKIPVIALLEIENATRRYSDLELAIIYARINSFCSDKVTGETLAISDYSDLCVLRNEDLITISGRIQNKDNFLVGQNDMIKFYRNYQNKRFFQFFATERELDDYELFSSVLGLTTLLKLSPPSAVGKVVIINNPNEESYNITFIVSSNKPLTSCEVIGGDEGKIDCSVGNSTFKITYKLPNTDFFNEIFQGVVNVQTDAPQDELERMRFQFAFQTFNIGYQYEGFPIWGIVAFSLLLVLGIIILGYRNLSKRKKLRIKKTLKLG